MKGNCFEIGTFQAFLDGELSQAEILEVSSHVADCELCSAMLAEAEDESAIVFPALDREFNSLVPTHRLWNMINGAISVEARNASFWKKAMAFFTAHLLTPSFAMAASVLLIFGLFATVWISRNSNKDGSGIAEIQQTNTLRVPIITNSFPAGPERIETSARDTRRNDNLRSQTINASFASNHLPEVRRAPAVNVSGSLPGEESYVKTIANLSRSVADEKDGIMRPSERISFERDMAVVDDAIRKMRTEVKRNPKNESARQVLYSSYQNKIDLLNSVSQKQELMASLR